MAKINHVHLHQTINISTLTLLCTNDTVINLSTTSISSPNLLATATDNISTATANNLSTPNDSNPTIKLTGQLSIVVHQPIPSSSSQTGSRQWNSGAGHPQNPNSQDYLSLLESTQKQQTLINNILPATVTNDKLLAAIFSFEIEEPSSTLLFSGAALNKKPITMMYTDAKVNGQFIKLILDSSLAGNYQIDRAASTRIITADGATKTPIGKINDFSFKVNSIVTPIKGKQKKELTWETDDLTWTNNEQEEPSSWEWKEEKRKGKEKKEENT
ncbi:hypothetical protein G9A89_011018 [Geosiphon pyriformis]|nr:hypothetical protein G9A89_011018 [Geosiphon pyriformis]